MISPNDPQAQAKPGDVAVSYRRISGELQPVGFFVGWTTDVDGRQKVVVRTDKGNEVTYIPERLVWGKPLQVPEAAWPEPSARITRRPERLRALAALEEALAMQGVEGYDDHALARVIVENSAELHELIRWALRRHAR